MCWDWFERRERAQERERVHDEEVREVEVEAEDESVEPTAAKDEERELVPA